MRNETIIHESDGDRGLSISITSGQAGNYLAVGINNLTTDDVVTVIIFTDNKTSFLEALKGATDECLLRVRDDEQKGERDDA